MDTNEPKLTRIELYDRCSRPMSTLRERSKQTRLYGRSMIHPAFTSQLY